MSLPDPITEAAEEREAHRARLEAVRNLRSHPVYDVLHRQAAMGHLPTAKALDALELPEEQRRQLADACTAVVAIKRSGANAEARGKAEEAASNIVDSLPVEQQQADYLAPPPAPDVGPYDPDELAAKVPQW